MFCAISDTVPEDPVFAVKTGLVYSRRLIEKAIAADGKCPVSDADLSTDDLVPVKAKPSVAPRPIAAASIPGLLKALQNEWDAQMLEGVQLKKHLEGARQELSQALYQHDAACRVIARLVRERDEARAALSGAASYTAAALSAGGEGETARPGISDDVIGAMVAQSKTLNKSRKKRKTPEDLTTVDAIKAWRLLSSHAPHLSTAPGITCLDYQTQTGLIATGGLDKAVKLFDLASSTTTATLTGHSKKVSGVILHPTVDAVVSSSFDHTVKIWSNQGGSYGCSFTLKPHTDAVVGIALQPCGDYVVSASLDRTWSFSNITTGRVLGTFADDSITSPYSCIDMHPDGLLIATGGDDSVVRIWDLKNGQVNVAKFEEHKGKIDAITFSENGYYMASGAEDGIVNLWDLRKQKKVNEFSLGGKPVSSLAFDHSGSYLAVGGDSVTSLLNVAEWSSITTLSGHSAAVTGVKFGANAASLVTVSADKNINVYSQ